MAINITMPDDSMTFNKREYKQYRDRLKSRPAGVYFLYDANDTLLYVGKTGKFRGRLRSHFRGNDVSEPFYRLIEYVTVYFVEDAYERELYETFAINTFQPEYNKSKAYFVDHSEEIAELEEQIRELEYEKKELEDDMCDDGLVDRDYEDNTQYLTSIYFHNQERLAEIESEVKILQKRKSLL